MTAGVALRAAAFRGPVHEIAEAVAVLPGEAEEFSRGEIVGFVAEERFKTPAKIGAVPGLEAIAASDDPVITQRAKHFRSTALV